MGAEIREAAPPERKRPGGETGARNRLCTSDNTPRKRNKQAIAIACAGETRVLHLAPRVAWMLRELVKAGARGVTQMDHPGARLSAYVHRLRGEGIAIETDREPHGGAFPGTHARYRLGVPLTIREG